MAEQLLSSLVPGVRLKRKRMPRPRRLKLRRKWKWRKVWNGPHYWSAVGTADLARVLVDLATAAVHTARTARLVMHHSSAAHTPTVVVHSWSAASGIFPKHAIADVSSAAHLRRCSIGSSSAAGVEPAVDDNWTTAAGVRAVDTPHDGSIATAVGPVVVKSVSAAGRGRAVDSVQHPAAATDGSADVVARGTTATSVRAIGPRSGDTIAAHLGPVVVNGPVAATGERAIGPGSGNTAATHLAADVIGGRTATSCPGREITLVDSAVTAHVGGGWIDIRSATTGRWAERLGDESVGATNMGAWIVRH